MRSTAARRRSTTRSTDGHPRRQPAGNASPPARSSRSSRTASANGYGRTRTAPQRLARYYNDTFNNLRLRTYDGSHLTFPGMNRSHAARQRSRQAPEGRRLAHRCRATTRCSRIASARARPAVMAAAAMEMKRLGLAKKPMIVVPNHLVEQWGAAFLALYPQAHIFVAGKEAFRRRQPPEGHVADRHRQL